MFEVLRCMNSLNASASELQRPFCYIGIVKWIGIPLGFPCTLEDSR